MRAIECNSGWYEVSCSKTTSTRGEGPGLVWFREWLGGQLHGQCAFVASKCSESSVSRTNRLPRSAPCLLPVILLQAM